MNKHVGQKLSVSNAVPKVINRTKTIFLEFWLMILRFVGYIPSHLIRRFFYILSGVKISPSSTIHIGAIFYHPPGVQIGDNTVIGDHCTLDGRAPLTIGHHTDIASQVLIYNDEHDINSDTFANSFGPVTIGDYVFIGPRAIILPGITIANGAVVAAGAVVTKNVPALEIWGGVPAKKIGDRRLKNPHYQLGRVALFQ